MIRTLFLPALALSTAMLGACASMGGEPPGRAVDGVLVGANGRTLYTYDGDVAGAGRSACNGPCATNWPPLMAALRATPIGKWSILVRDDGNKQWAYKGKPVYFWIADAKPGDRSGDGFGKVWQLARP